MRREDRSPGSARWACWPPRRKAGAFLGVSLLLVAVALRFDHPVRSFVVAHRPAPLVRVAKTMTKLGQNPVQLPIDLAVLLLGLALRRRKAVWFGQMSLLSWAVSGIGVQVLKHLVGRPRPDEWAKGAHLLGPTLQGSLSFPSGDAAMAGAWAVVFAVVFPRMRWVAYLLAAMVAASRVVLDRHFLSDAIGGYALGIGAAWACVVWCESRFGPLRQQPTQEERRGDADEGARVPFDSEA